MKGFIIQNKDEQYLAQGMWWFPHEKAEDAHVFPRKILIEIEEIDWHGDLPCWAIPASYTPEEGVIILGERFPL